MGNVWQKLFLTFDVHRQHNRRDVMKNTAIINKNIEMGGCGWFMFRKDIDVSA